MKDFLLLLKQPEYQHVLVNHLPLSGLLVAVLVLAGGLFSRSRPVILAGLAAVLVTAGSIPLVMNTGERAEDRVLAMADGVGGEWLEHHEHLAERWGKLYYLAAIAALVSLFLVNYRPGMLLPCAAGVLLLSLGSLLAGGVIAEAGGKIRHREFRVGPPPESHSDA